MSDLNYNGPKGSPLLYLREDKVKESLNTFFNVSKNFEKIIWEIDIGFVDKSSNVPFLFSSAKHLIVKAGKRKISMPGA